MTTATEYWKTRYVNACHAMQSGVAFSMDKSDQEPKHLRVGVNTALRQVAALAELLMVKGVFTEVEYYKALAEGMEAEVKSYEEELKEQYGGTADINLL